MTNPNLNPEGLRALAEKATPGPWKACGSIYEHMNCEVRSGAKGEGQGIAQVWDAPNAFHDGQFIAACREAVPALLDENERMREALADFVDAIRRAPISWETGVCCCGNSVEGHGFGDGHSPVDEGSYFVSNAIKAAEAALSPTQPEEVK